jgi:hypothetical protein
MTQEEAAATAQVNASIWTPELPLKASTAIIPSLMVSAVRDPTVHAPRISNIVANTIAILYDTDLEETLVAHAFATSSRKLISIHAILEVRVATDWHHC